MSPLPRAELEWGIGWMRFVWVTLVASVAIALFIVACGSEPQYQPTPASTSPDRDQAGGEQIPTESPSLEAVSPFASAVSQAVMNKDTQALVRMSALVSVSCVRDPSVAQAGPLCREGDEPGTVYPSFPIAVCQGGWSTDLPQLFTSVGERAGAPFVLAKLGMPSRHWPPEVPYGELVIVFNNRTNQPNHAVAIYLKGEHIVRVQNGCRNADGFIVGEDPVPTVLWRAS